MGVAGSDIKAEQAWAIFTGSSSVKIGIIDSGVETNHEDLSGKASGDLPAGSFHGTHVAGIAAAKANNGKGGRGVDWNAEIISRRIFEPGYVGDAAAANQIISAVNSGSHVLNNSWGGSADSTTIRAAFSYAYKLNRVAVVSMGNNNGSQTQYPAGYGQGIIAVGATRDNDVVSPFSNTGTHIDVTAPGGLNPFPNNDLHDIWSTWGGGNSYRYLAGTSMAAPVVTGIASLLKGYNSNLYNDDIENILQLSVDKVSGMGGQNWTTAYGYGRINAKKALDYLRSPWVINRYSTVGGTIVGQTNLGVVRFYGTSGPCGSFQEDEYVVTRLDVRKVVDLPGSGFVWGTSIGSTGWSAENPNFGLTYTNVVWSNGFQAELQTYIYDMWYLPGNPWDYAGRYPCWEHEVTFAYAYLNNGLGTKPNHQANSNLSLPKAFKIHPNFPNPFNPSTEIKFELPEDGTISLVIYDVLGRKIADLSNGLYKAGYHSTSWNANDVPSGVYFAHFTVSDESRTIKFSKINKLMLIK